MSLTALDFGLPLPPLRSYYVDALALARVIIAEQMISWEQSVDRLLLADAVRDLCAGTLS